MGKVIHRPIVLGILIGTIVLVVAGIVAAIPNPAGKELAKVLPAEIPVFVPSQTIKSSPAIEEVNGFAPGTKRVIAPTTSEADKMAFKAKGCLIIHELNDATALECPKAVIPSLNAKEDRIFYPLDLEADEQIGADQVWLQGIDGTGVIVAILDTGVDGTHIELKDSIVATKNFIKGPGFDADGHGTHVSGIVTANGVYQIDSNYATGVAPGAGIIVGKVCGDIGCYESDIAVGIEWVVAQGADVLNMSLGSITLFSGENCDGDYLADKSNWAVDQGVVVVASAGNDGADAVSSPACGSKVIAAGAVDKSDNVASWSNYGSALDLVAPGASILSTYSCKAAGNCRYYWYTWMSGTSMAAPHVAGTAALVLQKNPGYTVSDVKEALYNTAIDVGTKDKDGNGRVNALEAANYVKGCTLDAECDDSNECTTDACVDGTCVNTGVADDTTCTGGICCSAVCAPATCSVDGDCNDSNLCTTDTCVNAGTCNAYCSYTPIPDCVTAVCGDKVCAGSAAGEDCFTCPDDCRGTGKNNSKSCCGDGVCVNSENSKNCPVDCL